MLVASMRGTASAQTVLRCATRFASNRVLPSRQCCKRLPLRAAGSVVRLSACTRLRPPAHPPRRPLAHRRSPPRPRRRRQRPLPAADVLVRASSRSSRTNVRKSIELIPKSKSRSSANTSPAASSPSAKAKAAASSRGPGRLDPRRTPADARLARAIPSASTFSTASRRLSRPPHCCRPATWRNTYTTLSKQRKRRSPRRAQELGVIFGDRMLIAR